MKPFNLTQALAGQPVVTRDGRKVMWIAHDPGAHVNSRVIARIGSNPYHSEWREDGHYNDGNNLDLFMAPTKQQRWLHVLRLGSHVYCSSTLYDTKELADNAKYSDSLEKLATIPIEWEE